MTGIRELIACPICKRELAAQACKSCGIIFPKDTVPSFICRQMYASDHAYADAMRVIDFWGHGWRKRLQESDHEFLHHLDAAGLAAYADQALAWHKVNKTLMADVAAQRFSGAVALNVGCGAGEEAVILARGGATCIAMDITAPAAEITGSLLGRLGQGAGIQGDARFLPLKNESVDLVYSSGVLHHSADVPKSISEIHRVLRPGGVAYVMLYATWSIVFLQEKLMRWSGEKAWETEGRTNPCTTTYSVAECRKLFAAFASVTIDKRGASLKNFAKIGRFLPTAFDRFIDGPLGANINIIARK